MADLGRDLDVAYSTVAAWKQRGSIPAAYWRAIIRAARTRGLSEVTGDLLIEAHYPAGADDRRGGFAEDPLPTLADSGMPPGDEEEGDGQFSRWKKHRRSHFGTAEEIAEHVRALRSEWDRR